MPGWVTSGPAFPWSPPPCRYGLDVASLGQAIPEVQSKALTLFQAGDDCYVWALIHADHHGLEGNRVVGFDDGHKGLVFPQDEGLGRNLDAA